MTKAYCASPPSPEMNPMTGKVLTDSAWRAYSYDLLLVGDFLSLIQRSARVRRNQSRSAYNLDHPQIKGSV